MKSVGWRSRGFWLRAASILSLLLAAGHSAGGLKAWSPFGSNAVLEAMRSVKLVTQGVERTYLDFYLGFGWTLAVYFLLQTVLLWQMASVHDDAPSRSRAMIGAFAVANGVAAALAGTFILIVPMVSFLAIAGCLMAAWSVQGSSSERALLNLE